MPYIKLEDGRYIKFEGNPTKEQIDDVVDTVVGKKKSAPAQPTMTAEQHKQRFSQLQKESAAATAEANKPFSKFLGQGIAEPGKGFAVGVGKGLMNTGVGASALGEKILSAPLKLLGQKTEKPLGQEIQESGVLAPQGTAEKVGFGAEQIAELLVPTGIETGALKIGSKLGQILPKSKVVVPVAKTLLKSGAAALEFGGKTAIQTGGNKEQTLGSAAVSAALPAVGAIAKTPLTLMAEKLYQSALKPSTSLPQVLRKQVIKTGLGERVWLTQGGVEKVAQKIDSFENLIGQEIERAKGLGLTIKTKGMKAYVDEAKKFFENDVDVNAAKAAVKELDDIYKNFVQKYGDEIPIDTAQKIKVSTGQLLKKYYERLTQAGTEGRKQAVRYLKEQIAENAPVVGQVNQRLKALYEFDKALEKASGRIGNLNLLGLGTKLGAAAQGKSGAAIGLVADLLDRSAIKSGGAIVLNEVAKAINSVSKVSKIPANIIVRKLLGD